MSGMQIGVDSVPPNCDLLVLGEFGISNTTSASAISCSLFDEPVEIMTGIGTTDPYVTCVSWFCTGIIGVSSTMADSVVNSMIVLFHWKPSLSYSTASFKALV